MTVDEHVRKMVERTYGRYDAVVEVANVMEWHLGAKITVKGREAFVVWIAPGKLYVQYMPEAK